jgi:ribosomal protein S27E
MSNFFGAVWAATFRTIPCPRCCRVQTVARRPMPFEVICHDCGRSIRVTERGAEPARPG